MIVVCAFGRNNVPECQPDGTWSDIPRCIEHDPGFEPQRTKLCPGIPGYCSDSPIGQLCEFDCLIGADIRFVTNLVIGYLLTTDYQLCTYFPCYYFFMINKTL